jgi:hypothetical protein
MPESSLNWTIDKKTLLKLVYTVYEGAHEHTGFWYVAIKCP